MSDEDSKRKRPRGCAALQWKDFDRQWRLPLDDPLLLLLLLVLLFLLSHDSLPVELLPDERLGELP
jgi:hypothetical protein